MGRKAFVGGNWKMNTQRESATALATAVAKATEKASRDVEVVVFPPFPYLLPVGDAIGPRVRLGAQDAYTEASGAFTGEVSVAMLADCGATHALTGHSERRHVLGESDTLVGAKTRAVLDGGLTCVVCVGETLEQREAGETDTVNERQTRAALEGVSAEGMARVVIAYEPVWAIGTGRTASPADAQQAHAALRALLAKLYDDKVAAATRIIYGGSVKGANAAELFGQPDIDGGLIGGASLDAEEFGAIVTAAAKKVH